MITATMNRISDVKDFKAAALLTDTGAVYKKVHAKSIEFTTSKDKRKGTYSYKIYKGDDGKFRLRRKIYGYSYRFCQSKGYQEYQLGRVNGYTGRTINYRPAYGGLCSYPETWQRWPEFNTIFEALKWFEGYLRRNKKMLNPAN